MNPPIKGPDEGPTKGANDTSAIGLCISSGENISATVPPATDKKVPPANPQKNLVTMIAVIELVTAEGIVKTMKAIHDTK